MENVRALRVLDMEGCGYLVHPAYLVGFMERSLISSSELVFVVLDDSSPRVCMHAAAILCLSFRCHVMEIYSESHLAGIVAKIVTESFSGGTGDHYEEPLGSTTTTLFSFSGTRDRALLQS